MKTTGNNISVEEWVAEHGEHPHCQACGGRIQEGEDFYFGSDGCMATTSGFRAEATVAYGVCGLSVLVLGWWTMRATIRDVDAFEVRVLKADGLAEPPHDWSREPVAARCRELLEARGVRIVERATAPDEGWIEVKIDAVPGGEGGFVHLEAFSRRSHSPLYSARWQVFDWKPTSREVPNLLGAVADQASDLADAWGSR